MATPHPVRLVLAFAAVYVVWGSTYLAIDIAIESLPPFGMAAARFMIAGVIVLAWCAVAGRRFRAACTPSRLALAAAVGILMLTGGNGLVVWAIAHGAPTGLSAVVVATTPFWLVGLDRLVDRTRRIAPTSIVGLLIGFIGIVILAAPGRDIPVAGLSITALCVVLLATLCWACGSIVSRQGARHRRADDATTATTITHAEADPLVATGFQMVFGGLVLGAWSLATEDPSAFAIDEVSLRSWLALAYLVIFGSVIAYTAFIWLLRHVSAAAVGTYAYVNPVVALALGIGFNAEPVSAQAVVASVLILVAVATITVGAGAASRRGRVALAERAA